MRTTTAMKRTMGIMLLAGLAAATLRVPPAHADTEFDTPSGVAVDLKGNVYIADTGNGRVVELSQVGRLMRQWSVGCDHLTDGSPSGVAVDRLGNVYVSDPSHDCVLKYSARGQFVAQFGTEGDGEFSAPRGLAVGGRGNVFVANSGKHSVEKLAPNGYVLNSWATFNADDGAAVSPQSVAVDPKGTVYSVVCACDDINVDPTYAIQKRNSIGELLAQWSPANSLAGIAVDGRGTVFVGNHQDSTIVKLSATGRMLASIEAKDLISPRSIAVDRRGNLYVADADNNVIVKISSSGREVAAWR